MKKIKKIVLTIILILIVILAVACIIFRSQRYTATAEATALIQESEANAGQIVFAPEEPKAGLIFYPGGNVEYTAYAPLLKACAEEGFFCVLVKMPADLAVFDIKAADGIQEQYPDIENWYIGGHSLGGAMAATYVADHADEYDGLILLAAYSTSDLTDSGIQVLSIYGSEDGVMSQDSYMKYHDNLPKDAVEHVIAGGCHAQFGDYGPQSGDGTPTITREEQISETVDVMKQLLNR